MGFKWSEVQILSPRLLPLVTANLAVMGSPVSGLRKPETTLSPSSLASKKRCFPILGIEFNVTHTGTLGHLDHEARIRRARHTACAGYPGIGCASDFDTGANWRYREGSPRGCPAWATRYVRVAPTISPTVSRIVAAVPPPCYTLCYAVHFSSRPAKRSARRTNAAWMAPT